MSTHRKQGNQGKQEQKIGTRKTETLERNESHKKSPRTETTCDRVGKLDITLHRNSDFFHMKIMLTHIVYVFWL